MSEHELVIERLVDARAGGRSSVTMYGANGEAAQRIAGEG